MGFFKAIWVQILFYVKHSQYTCQFRETCTCSGLDSQQLQRGQAVKNSAGQLSDLITIQNPAHKQQQKHWKLSTAVLSSQIYHQSADVYYDTLFQAWKPG